MASAFGSAYALTLADRRTRPYILSVEVNNRCNLSCRSCFISPEYGYDSGTREMSLGMLEEKIQTQLATLAGDDIIVAFAGKEPLFDYDRFTQAYAQVHGKVTGIVTVTNGDIALVRRNLDILKEFDGIDISLNGGTEAENAVTRGKHSFERALEGIALLKEYHLNVGISYLVMRENKNAVNTFYKAVEQTGVQRVSYSIARNPSGELQFDQEKAINLLVYAIEQTPHEVKILVELKTKREMQLLAQKLRGNYVEANGTVQYTIPKITGTSWEITAPTQETSPLHIRLLYDGRLMHGKEMFVR